MKEEILICLTELVEGQKKTLLENGRQIVSYVTSEDVLQPNDYPLLENSPSFRYEEGILAGMQTVQTALLALFRDLETKGHD